MTGGTTSRRAGARSPDLGAARGVLAQGDWQGVEARLMRELPRAPQSTSRSFLGRLRLPAAGLVAVAAVLTLVVARKPAQCRPSRRPSSALHRSMVTCSRSAHDSRLAISR